MYRDWEFLDGTALNKKRRCGAGWGRGVVMGRNAKRQNKPGRDRAMRQYRIGNDESGKDWTGNLETKRDETQWDETGTDWTGQQETGSYTARV